MGTLTYQLRPSSKDQNKGTINISYSWSKKYPPFRKSTQLIVPIKSWDAKRQRLKNTTEVYRYGKQYNDRVIDICIEHGLQIRAIRGEGKWST
jgi:hypothetical protein